MARSRQLRYPWGTETPGPRLRITGDKSRVALKQVDAPGVKRIPERIGAAVEPIRLFVEAMEFVAREGLRTGARTDRTVQGADVAAALGEVYEALGPLAESSALTLTPRYEAFVGAVTRLLALADTAVEHGVEGTGGSDPTDPWRALQP